MKSQQIVVCLTKGMITRPLMMRQTYVFDALVKEQLTDVFDKRVIGS
jgi:hypothetical protein